jgi:hypothetical protein
MVAKDVDSSTFESGKPTQRISRRIVINNNHFIHLVCNGGNVIEECWAGIVGDYDSANSTMTRTIFRR